MHEMKESNETWVGKIPCHWQMQPIKYQFNLVAGAIGISDSRGKASPVLNVLDTEQNAIVEHIDKVLEKTNAVIADKKAQLEILESYKKSIIYEYVTGKKVVPQQ